MNFSLGESNATGSNYVVTSADRVQSLVYPVFQFIFLSVSVYLLAAIGYYTKKKRNGISREKSILFGLLLFLVIWSVGRFLVEIFLFYFRFTYCTTVTNVFFVSYFAGITFLYIFLWYRQHTLYALPIMDSLLVSRLPKRDYLLVFIILIGIGLCGSTILTSPPRRFAFIEETQTCIYAEPEGLGVNLVGAAAYIIAWLVQGSVLFCFIYILRRHQTQMKHIRRETSSTNQSRPETLQRLIRNCTIATSICLATDTVACFLFYFFPSAFLLYSFLLLDLDYIINVSCALFCFTAWKEMISPWSCKSSKKQRQIFCCK